MYAAQNQEFNVIDSLSGSVSDWYESCDDSIKKSDVIPGTYEYTISPSYGNVGEIQENASTMVDVSSTRFTLVSIDNSFIELKQEVRITPNKSFAGNKSISQYYIGYQYAPEAIMQYRIYSNTDLIQTVNWANYEWFMMRNSVQPEAKEQSDLYATIDKIRRKDPNVPGVYVDLNANTGSAFTINLNLRIPLDSFLMLRNLRYFPQFAGKLTIELIPSYKNLVVTPCFDPTSYENVMLTATLSGAGTKLSANQGVPALRTFYANADNTLAANYGFFNVNQECPFFITADDAAGANMAIDTIKFGVSTQTTKDVKIHLAIYQLQMDVFNNLSSKYISTPLFFPIQIIESKDFTTVMGADAVIDNAMTVQLKHADAMFVVFKQTDSYSCFQNPQINYQFNIDGKFYPRQPFDSVNDRRTTNQTLDALNFNNCTTTSINKDIHTSLQPFYVKQTSNAGGALTASYMYTSGDRSNACIGIPLADSEDFMGGISTPGTVQVQLVGSRLGTYGFDGVEFTSPVAIFTEDAILKIRAIKPPGAPQISFTHASIEQVLATAGAV